ncbi:MAG: DUF1273 family protein [Eubacterium sp.]|nr:DUF1273 family protein [Eubacterium sp.]
MKNVCFTGHRTLRGDNEFQIRRLLDEVVTELIRKGAVNFYCGGAMGWDTICANLILYHKKRRAPHIRLHMILPCPPEQQTLKWQDADRRLYYMILENADDAEIVSDSYTDDCMKKRNARLVANADCCVCYYDGSTVRSGTAQTVRMAREKGIDVVNIYDMAED